MPSPRLDRGTLLAALFGIVTIAMLAAAGTVNDDEPEALEAGGGVLDVDDAEGVDDADGGRQGLAGSADPAAPEAQEATSTTKAELSVVDELALNARAVPSRADRSTTTTGSTTTTEPSTTTAEPVAASAAGDPAEETTEATETTAVEAESASEATPTEETDGSETVPPAEGEGSAADQPGETTDTTDTTDTTETSETTETTEADTTETTAHPDGWVDAGHGVFVPPVLIEIRRCESTHNYQAANPSSSARGAYQFLTGSWAAYGHKDRYGVSQAHLATNAQQDEAALITWQRDGTRPWNASRSCWD